MAKLVKIERAGTVLFVEEKKVDFYLEHGYTVLQSDKTPAHLKPPFYSEPKPPAVIKVQVVESDQPSAVSEQPVQPFEVEQPKAENQSLKADSKPKRKYTRKKKADK